MTFSTNRTVYGSQYLSYQENRGCLRKIIRKFYLKKIAGYCLGNSIDIGCGNGSLLQILDDCSVGFEVNQEAVKLCKNKNLPVYS
jgi:hypothetical protein